MGLKLLARIGYLGKGTVYLLVGVRAIRAAFERVPTGGSEEAMERWGDALGMPFLLALSIGLGCFTLWRAVQVWREKEAGWLARLGYALSALLYFKLGKGALELVWESPDPDDPSEQEQMAAFLFSQPLGQALVALAGAVILTMGVYQFWKAYRSRFEEQEGFNAFTVWLARAGLAARGVAFLLLGSYVLRAAWMVRPEQVASLSEVMSMLRQQGGLWALALMGVGFTAYGLSMGVQARYYRPGQKAA